MYVCIMNVRTYICIYICMYTWLVWKIRVEPAQPDLFLKIQVEPEEPKKFSPPLFRSKICANRQMGPIGTVSTRPKRGFGTQNRVEPIHFFAIFCFGL